jgi:hypothetical protein
MPSDVKAGPIIPVACPAAAVDAQGAAPNETGSQAGLGSGFGPENTQIFCNIRRHDAQENANVLKNGEIRQAYSIFFRLVQENSLTQQRQCTPRLFSFENAAGSTRTISAASRKSGDQRIAPARMVRSEKHQLREENTTETMDFSGD